MKIPIRTLLAMSIVTLAPLAEAQEPTGTGGVFKPFASLPPLATAPIPGGIALTLGEPTGDGDLGGRYASMPVRLSITGDIFPQARLFPNCASREEASGNSIHGMPVQRYTMLALGPHLVLSGFSMAGCPIDSGMGGALTYSVPIDKKLWLVAGAGIYSVPARDTIPAQTRTDLRVDLVTKTDSGRVLNVGIGKRGVSFGGAW
jgi:hypothetical protein